MLRAGDKPWAVVDAAAYTDEGDLQKLLSEVPGVLSATQFGGPEFLASVREFGLPGSGSTDLVAVAAEGSILVAECKLAKNDEIKRKVIGQIFEYAAYLWKMSYEEFDLRFQKISGKPLAELVRHKLDLRSEALDEWSVDEFREHVGANLAQGNFTLAIVVDSLNDELSRTISYLNERGRQSNFLLYALQLMKFRQDGVDILVPQLHGASVDAVAERAATQWNERGKVYEEFFRELVERFKQSSPGATDLAGSGGHVGYLGFSAGVLGGAAGFFWSVAQGKRLRCELYLDGPDLATVKVVFDQLHAMRDEIETRFGASLEWERNDLKRSSRVATYHTGNPYDTPELRDDLLKWGANTMQHLVSALKPAFAKLHN